MYKVNRFVILLMVAVLVVGAFGLTGCKKKAAEDKLKIGLVFDIGGLGDKSFNDSAYEGLVRAAAEFDIETIYLEPNDTGSDREELLRSLAEEGYAYIVANGFLFTDAVISAAADFPGVKFGLTDGYVPDLTKESNIICLGFAEHEGSFLVGAAAALKSKTGKIGFVGGMNIPLIQKFEAGYRAGAAFINPNITVIVDYIGTTGEAFKNPTAGRELALAQIGKGCDVIYHASGLSGVGVIAACAEKQKWVIGVDSDQYLTAKPEEQPYVLTSMLKRVDVAVYETIKQVVEGKFEGGYTSFNLAVDGVGYSKSNAEAIADIAERLDEIKGQIAAGTIAVPSNYEELDDYLASLGG